MHDRPSTGFTPFLNCYQRFERRPESTFSDDQPSVLDLANPVLGAFVEGNSSFPM